MAQGWPSYSNKAKDAQSCHIYWNFVEVGTLPVFYWSLGYKDIKLKPVLVTVSPMGEACQIREETRHKTSQREKPQISDMFRAPETTHIPESVNSLEGFSQFALFSVIWNQKTPSINSKGPLHSGGLAG